MAAAGITFTAGGEMVLTAQIQMPQQGASTWGNPIDEVVTLLSRDGGRSFTFALVSRPDRRQSHWLSDIERATGCHAVGDDAGVIYTGGSPGVKNTELLSNNVLSAAPCLR
jgi:hypothetical protein